MDENKDNKSNKRQCIWLDKFNFIDNVNGDLSNVNRIYSYLNKKVISEMNQYMYETNPEMFNQYYAQFFNTGSIQKLVKKNISQAQEPISAVLYTIYSYLPTLFKIKTMPLVCTYWNKHYKHVHNWTHVNIDMINFEKTKLLINKLSTSSYKTISEVTDLHLSNISYPYNICLSFELEIFTRLILLHLDVLDLSCIIKKDISFKHLQVLIVGTMKILALDSSTSTCDTDVLTTCLFPKLHILTIDRGYSTGWDTFNQLIRKNHIPNVERFNTLESKFYLKNVTSFWNKLIDLCIPNICTMESIDTDILSKINILGSNYLFLLLYLKEYSIHLNEFIVIRIDTIQIPHSNKEIHKELLPKLITNCITVNIFLSAIVSLVDLEQLYSKLPKRIHRLMIQKCTKQMMYVLLKTDLDVFIIEIQELIDCDYIMFLKTITILIKYKRLVIGTKEITL